MNQQPNTLYSEANGRTRAFLSSPNELADQLAGDAVIFHGGVLQTPNQKKNNVSAFGATGKTATLTAPNQRADLITGANVTGKTADLSTPNNRADLVAAFGATGKTATLSAPNNRADLVAAFGATSKTANLSAPNNRADLVAAFGATGKTATLSAPNQKNNTISATGYVRKTATLAAPNQKANTIFATGYVRKTATLNAPNNLAELVAATAATQKTATLQTPNNRADQVSGSGTHVTGAQLTQPNNRADTINSYAYHPIFTTQAFARAPGNGDAALPWGTNVRKVAPTVGTTSDVTTKTTRAAGTGGTTVSVRPFASNAVNTQDGNYGWGIDPTDLNSSAAHQVQFPAADWTLTFSENQTLINAQGGANFHFNLYRVGAAPTYTRTLLFTSNGANVNTLTDQVIVSTAIGSAFTLGAGETLMWELFDQGVTNATNGQTFTYRVGHWTGTAPADMKFTFPAFSYT